MPPTPTLPHTSTTSPTVTPTTSTTPTTTPTTTAAPTALSAMHPSLRLFLLFGLPVIAIFVIVSVLLWWSPSCIGTKEERERKREEKAKRGNGTDSGNGTTTTREDNEEAGRGGDEEMVGQVGKEIGEETEGKGKATREITITISFHEGRNGEGDLD